MFVTACAYELLEVSADDRTRTYPDGELDVLSALDEARCLAILALGHPDRTASLWYTNEALDLLQRIVP